MEDNIQHHGHLVRVDKDFAMNGFDFDASGFFDNVKDDIYEYNRNVSLCRNLIVYFNKLHQTDLFDSQYLDPYDFAEKMGYSRSFLYQTVKNPLVIGEETFRTRLENVLAHCLKHNLLLIHNEFIPEEKKIKKTFIPIKILDYLQLITDPKSPRKKKYLIGYSTDAVRTINSYFSRINLSAYRTLRDYNAQELYTYIIAKRDNMIYKNLMQDKLYFDELCQKAGINYKSPTRNKMELKNKLDLLIQHDPIIGCVFDFVQNVKKSKDGSNNEEKSKHSYVPIIKLVSKTEIKDFWDRKYLECITQLKVLYSKTQGSKPIQSQKFADWLKSKFRNEIDFLVDVYLAAVDKCTNGSHTPDRQSKEVFEFLGVIKNAPHTFFSSPTSSNFKKLNIDIHA